MQETRLVLGSTDPLPFLMVDATDHVAPFAGDPATVAIELSRGGTAPFAAVAGTPEGLSNGWFQPPSGVVYATVPGPLLLHAEAPGADPVDRRFQVVPASGVAPLIVGAARYPLTFLMVDAADRVTGLAGLTPTVAIRKVGGTFLTPAGAVVEVGLGWYAVSGDPADAGTPGPLLLHAEAPGAEPTDEQYDVAGTAAVSGVDRMTLTLLAVKAMLVHAGLFTTSNCAVSLDDEPFPTPSPPCAWITPGSFPFDGGLNLGGGRYESAIDFGFTVRLILRRTSDVDGQDLQLLTNPLRGGWPMVYAVINALQEQFPFDLNGNPLTTVGVKAQRVDLPRRYGKDPMMAVVPIAFATRVLLDLKVPDPS